MTDVICLSILQTEINSGFEGLQVTLSIRMFDLEPNYTVRPKFSINLQTCSMKSLQAYTRFYFSFQIDINTDY